MAPITVEGSLPSGAAALGAFAQFSDGSGRYVPATWSSSNEGVITIAEGAFRARAPGTAVITATFDGRSDSETFTVEAGVPGSWTGTYVVQQCGASTSAMHELLCTEPVNGSRGGVLRAGTTLPITLDIAQPGIGPEITATAVLGPARGTLNGINRGGGFFSLAGDLTASGTAVSITYWDAQVVKDAMEGFINYRVQVSGVAGIGEVATKLAGMTRQ